MAGFAGAGGDVDRDDGCERAGVSEQASQDHGGASPGGGTDIIARMLAEKFGAELKQPFVVENRPGASNTIAADLTAKAPADGHTLLVATNTGQAIAPHLDQACLRPDQGTGADCLDRHGAGMCWSSIRRSGRRT